MSGCRRSGCPPRGAQFALIRRIRTSSSVLAGRGLYCCDLQRDACGMLKFKISETSGRIPVALLALELGVSHAAVWLAAYLVVWNGDGADPAGLVLWWLRASLFAVALMVCMAAFKLYQGRPRERTGTALLRLAGSFALAAALLQLLYLLLPVLRIAPGVLLVALGLAFFFLGTMRPVFLDSVAERRARHAAASRQPPPQSSAEAEDMSREEFHARLARNAKHTSLTAQHRITRRGL